jgi:histone-lysine N-methyltransferase SUV420H
MARKPKETSPAADSSASSEDANAVWWKFTKVMNMRDLSRDDDYLSHLFVEKVSSVAAAPLLVHKMDPTRRLPKTDAVDVLTIVQRVRLMLLVVVCSVVC